MRIQICMKRDPLDATNVTTLTLIIMDPLIGFVGKKNMPGLTAVMRYTAPEINAYTTIQRLRICRTLIDSESWTRICGGNFKSGELYSIRD
jgi:hypothetical protein